MSIKQKVWVIGVRAGPGNSCTYALLECKQGIPNHLQGISVQLANKMESCLIQLKTQGSSQAEHAEDESRSTAPLATIGPEFFAALGDFVSKCQKNIILYLGTGYRNLRFSSGKHPTGEDSFEEWLGQATQALDNLDNPEIQKKNRSITESLKGPASDAI